MSERSEIAALLQSAKKMIETAVSLLANLPVTSVPEPPDRSVVIVLDDENELDSVWSRDDDIAELDNPGVRWLNLTTTESSAWPRVVGAGATVIVAYQPDQVDDR